jgi:methionine-rich copper-binding protein CopC
MTRFPVGILAVTAMLIVFGQAEARPLHVKESFPLAEAILDGRNAQYVIRFDGLVDHGASRIEISNNGRIVETLVAIGDSEPDVLAASAPALAPGRYQLHWHAKSTPDGDFTDGFIPFTVAR